MNPDQTCFPCINIRWVPREVLKTAQLLLHKSIEKSTLERYFDAIFWRYFVLIFLHRRTKMISICILVPVPSLNNYSIMAENWQEFTWWLRSQNVVDVFHLF